MLAVVLAQVLGRRSGSGMTTGPTCPSIGARHARHAMQPSAVPYHHWARGFPEGCWRGALISARNTSRPAQTGYGHATTTELVVFCPPPACVCRHVWCACGVGVLLAGVCTPSMHPMHTWLAAEGYVNPTGTSGNR